MKKIYLRNKNKYVLVDDEDFDRLNKYIWHCKNGYGVRRDNNSGKRENVYMHRLIMNTPDGLFIDHIDRNRLNNQKNNLKNVSWAENRLNISCHSDSKIKERNIDFMKAYKKFRVRITRYKKLVFQAHCKTLSEAITVRDNYYDRANF